MDNIVTLDFPVGYEGFGDISFSFLTHDKDYVDDSNNRQSAYSENTTLEVKKMGSKNPSINYHHLFTKDLGTVIENSTELKYLRHNANDSGVFSAHSIKDNFTINKIEFEHRDNKVVNVKLELQTDTEDSAIKAKNKARAYGIAIK